jgi:hypothetical protein
MTGKMLGYYQIVNQVGKGSVRESHQAESWILGRNAASPGGASTAALFSLSEIG